MTTPLAAPPLPLLLRAPLTPALPLSSLAPLADGYDLNSASR